jgi:hypothetical protein
LRSVRHRALVAARRARRRVTPCRAESAVFGLGEDDRLREVHPHFGVLPVEDTTMRTGQTLHRDFELFTHLIEEQGLQSACGLNRRLARHERHPTRVAAEIDGSQMRVRGDDVDVLDLDAELFGSRRPGPSPTPDRYPSSRRTR